MNTVSNAGQFPALIQESRESALSAVGYGHRCARRCMHVILKSQGDAAAQVERAILSFVPMPESHLAR